MRQKIFIGLLMMIFVSSICLAAPADRTKSTASGSGASKVAWRYGVDETAPFRVITPYLYGQATASNDINGNIWMESIGTGWRTTRDYAMVIYKSTPVEVRTTAPPHKLNQLQAFVDISLPTGRLFEINEGASSNSSVNFSLEIRKKATGGADDRSMILSSVSPNGTSPALADGDSRAYFRMLGGDHVRYEVQTISQELLPGEYYLQLIVNCTSYGMHTAGALYGAKLERLRLQHTESLI